MSGYQTNGTYDNPNFVPDGGESTGGIPLEPAPRNFLPRIITGSEYGGQKQLNPPPPPYSPDPPGFKKEMDPKFTEIATISKPEQPGAEDDEGEDRDTWDKPLEFLLSCISMSVGLGNIWRFPAAAANNGGGAFLIPYLIVLLLIGRPLYYLEMCLGQFSHFGQVKVWNMLPLFKGVGYGSLMGVISVVSYYCYLMAITVRFFIASFAKTLPWAECDSEKMAGFGKACNDSSKFAEYYYKHTVNPQLASIEDGLGDFNWKLLLCLVFSWVLIFLSLVKGVKSSGKVAYFTAIFPYVVLFILLIRGATLKGAWDGVKVFLNPEWDKILEPRVWYAAVSQCFFSLNIGFGSVIMFSSYNGFKQNIYKDALIISCLDTFTSLLAGCTIFCVIGNMMYEQNKSFAELGEVGGPSLAFILYPSAIASFGWAPQLFAVLFFLMLFTLGIGSATSLAGAIITIICDQFPNWTRWMVTSVVCAGGFLLGLMYVTEGGMFMLELIDQYGSSMVIYWVVMIECAAICYGYGLNNICNDIEFMLGRTTGPYWRICWGVIIPVGLLGNMIYYLFTEEEFKSGGVAYPKHATALGWAWTGFSVGLIPLLAVFTIFKRKASSFGGKVKEALTPTHRWGPQKPKLRREWLEFRAKKDAEGAHKYYLF